MQRDFDSAPVGCRCRGGYGDIGESLADPSALAMGAFATTVITVAFFMLGWRGVNSEAISVGNLCFVAGVGLVISAQWAMLRGDTFSYTVLCAFGTFYIAYGVSLIPWFGVLEAYGGPTPEYYNAFGYFFLMWAIFDLSFLIAALRLNIAYILLFAFVALCLAFDAGAQFAMADGRAELYDALRKTGGVFGLLAGLIGYYCATYYLCAEVMPFTMPMGNTARYFRKKREF